MRSHLAALAIAVGCSSSTVPRPAVRIAAASDLSRAFEELGPVFAGETGITPVFDFGSSGRLAQQIAQGAPYALFAAANEGYAEQAARSGRCDRATLRTYARGRIVVWSPRGAPAPTRLADLAEPRFRRIAIANPEHAPYGRAAQQALERAGVWDAVQDRIVIAESVETAMEYAREGSVDATIVSASLAVVFEGGASLRVDPALYDPLDQVLVVCGTGEAARAAQHFADFMAGTDGREVMLRYGFVLPAP